VIKTSDWIIDMGPEGGAEGGTVVAQGTPEDIAAVPESYTGKFLGEVVGRGGSTQAAAASARKRRRKVSA
jgi:excinuclease ABC subunit A